MIASNRPFAPLKETIHPEPVPGASQLAALPFAAGVAGYLKSQGIADRTRVVLHRVVSREGGEYLQQLSSYAGGSYDRSTAGRMKRVTEGALGKSYALKKVVRTKNYADSKSLLADLELDLRDVGDNRPVDEVARSYVAIPMISKSGNVVTILFADTYTHNAFSNDKVLDVVLSMCRDFCFIIDSLEEAPLPGIENYDIRPGEPVKDKETVYPRLQEVVEGKEVPTYHKVSCLNFEAAPQ